MQSFSLDRSYTPQRKLLPESCAALRNVVRMHIAIKVGCLPPQKNIRNYSEYTAAGTRRAQRQAGTAAAPGFWATPHYGARAAPWKRRTGHIYLGLRAKNQHLLLRGKSCPSEASKCFADDGDWVRILIQILLPNLFQESFALWWVEWGRQFSVSTGPTGKLFLKWRCFDFIFLVAWVLCCSGTTWSWRWHPSSLGESHHKQTSWSLLKGFLQLQSALLLQTGHLLPQFSSGLLLLHRIRSA